MTPVLLQGAVWEYVTLCDSSSFKWLLEIMLEKKRMLANSIFFPFLNSALSQTVSTISYGNAEAIWEIEKNLSTRIFKI